MTAGNEDSFLNRCNWAAERQRLFDRRLIRHTCTAFSLLDSTVSSRLSGSQTRVIQTLIRMLPDYSH